jgi:hypothetical protein
MTGTPIVSDDSKLIAESPVDLDAGALRLSSERNMGSVYANYWQERSGFFNPVFQTLQPADE